MARIFKRDLAIITSSTFTAALAFLLSLSVFHAGLSHEGMAFTDAMFFGVACVVILLYAVYILSLLAIVRVTRRLSMVKLPQVQKSQEKMLKKPSEKR